MVLTSSGFSFHTIDSDADYGPLPSNISFSFANPRSCFHVTITNDSISEGVEAFIVEVSHSSVSRRGIQDSAINFAPGKNRTIIRILKTCYIGELRLRGGYDVNQGRVEICYNGVYMGHCVW